MKTKGKDLLEKIKSIELQGENSHRIYSPPYRPILSQQEILDRNPMFAAVNILLYRKNKEWYFPLIRRTTNEKDKHSGEISLPGGKYESQDKDFWDTAARETFEEIGIEVRQNCLIRQISPIYIPPSNFYVYPFLSYTTKKNPIFSIQKTEAMEVIEFPLEILLSLPNIPTKEILPSTNGVEVPIIRLKEHIIWGATSMILNECSYLLKNS